MEIKEFLSALLQAILIASIPVVATYIKKSLQAFAEYLKSKIENDKSKHILDDIAKAVTDAVTYTSQTYVDALKQSGSFTMENQGIALQKSYDKAKMLLGDQAIEYIELTYGNLKEYLTTRIEAEVRKQKVCVQAVEAKE